MATIILQAAGAFIGGVLGPVGSAIGSAAGAFAGYTIDRALLDSTRHYEGPRLSGQRPFTAEEGAPLARAYGTVRTGGTLIWATHFEEESTTTRQGGKGGPKTTSYSYFANAAFAICEGEIAGIRRIWADGREIDRELAEIRVYRGGEDQPVDPLIEAKQGNGNAPAYRGTAYVVFDRFPIDDYGRRLPQFQFEVLRPVGDLNGQIRSVALIPGSTEYGLSPTPVTLSPREGEASAVNRHALSAATDFDASLDELQMLCPNLETVALVVSWFGDDLRAGHCTIRPKVTQGDPKGLSAEWIVSGVDRAHAMVVSQSGGGAAYGGTPTDKSVMQAIAAIKARGFKVTLYPFILMDVPPGNGLPDPHGGASQPAYPWRGRITCDPAPGLTGTADKTAAARSRIETFCGGAAAADFDAGSDTIAFTGANGDWGYRRFLLHHAQLAVAAGGVDGFLLGSEMRGLTTLHDADDRFSFVEALQELASDVRAIVGDATLLTYGADWSEYFGYHPADASGDLFFHLDGLWAHDDVDAVGIDNYMPLSDWRDDDYAGGNPDGFDGPYDIEGLTEAVASGEGFDWFYETNAKRRARDRSAITDGAYGKPWVFRYKDIVDWWSNGHFDRIGGLEKVTSTGWVPQSKPVMFTELGCAAVDKGPNQPNVFPDPKSSENAAPYFSSGGRSDLAQRRFLQAHYAYWSAGNGASNPFSSVYGARMLDPADICVWSWDARPFPAFPLFQDVWSDGGNWLLGHWLNGRLGGVAVGDLINTILAYHGLSVADTAQADGTLSGYLIDSPQTARAAIDPIVDLFGLAVHEDADGLVFSTEARSAGAAYEADELVIDDDKSVIDRTRVPDHALPAQAQLDFRDPLNDYQAATVETARAGAAGNAKSFASFPGVLSTGEAQGLVSDWLRRKWAAREQVSFALAMNAIDAEPGALVRLPGSGQSTDYLIDKVETGLARSVTARRVDRAAPTPQIAETPFKQSDGIYIGVRPMAMLLDLPMTNGSRQPEEQLRLAARAKPWRIQVALVSPETSGFEVRSTVTRRASIGILVSDLEGDGFEGRIDRHTAIMVEMFDGELASVSRLQMLNGANAAAIRSASGVWEIVQFQDAEEVSASVWRLTELLRGQLGTNDALVEGALTGAPFVLLNDAVQPAGLHASEIGLDLNWRVGPRGYDISDANFTGIEVAGGKRARLPLSPVHVKADVRDGGIAFSWVRRGRIDADSWLSEEIPLGEGTESYRVEIAAAGGAVVRTATVGQTGWLYAAEDLASDFEEQPVTIEISVSQISQATGPGVAAFASVQLN